MKSIYEILKEAEGVYGARASGAGYTTRLYPLTKDKAKLLLEVAGKKITDHIVEKIVQVPEVDEIIILTDYKFTHQFEGWGG